MKRPLKSSVQAIVYTAALAAVAAMSMQMLSAPVLMAQAAPATPAAKFVDSARVEIDAAVIASDPARLNRAVVLLDRALTAFPNDPYLLHYRGYANYRRVLTALITGKLPESEPLLRSAIADLEQSGDKLPWAESYALLSTLHGLRIVIDPSLGATVGAEIGAVAGRAAQLGPNNPRVLLMQARIAQNTPPEYGGSIAQARELVARAIKAFETDKPAPLAPAWGKTEALELQRELGSGR